MNVKIFELAKPHIESGLAKGNEKLDIANLLTKSKKYGGAIKEYVGAYEEIGQSLFLMDTVSNNEKISEQELEKYFKPGTHDQKILSSYITRRDGLKKHSDKDFEKIKNSKIGKDFHNPYSRKGTINETNKRITIYSKVHKLRQVFDYSHNRDGQIVKSNYSDDELETVCYLLKCECLISYYETRLDLEGQNLKVQGYDDDTLLSKVPSLQSYQNFKELSKDINSKNNQLRRIKGLKFIESF